MDIVFTSILVVHILMAVAIVGLVLLQHGKGADMGAAFGSGSSGSLFGATGSANFLSRTTAVLAGVFFVTSLGLTWLASHHRGAEPAGVMKGVVESTAPPGKEAPKNNAVPGEGNAPAAPAAPMKGNEVPK
jgi:preprotein translocase subunit SecG